MKDLIKDPLLREKKKTHHPEVIEPMTSRVLLCRRVLYCWATTTALQTNYFIFY